LNLFSLLCSVFLRTTTICRRTKVYNLQSLAGICFRLSVYPPSRKTSGVLRQAQDGERSRTICLWMSSLRSRSGCFGGVGNAKNFPLRRDSAPDEGGYYIVYPPKRGEKVPRASFGRLRMVSEAEP